MSESSLALPHHGGPDRASSGWETLCLIVRFMFSDIRMHTA